MFMRIKKFFKTVANIWRIAKDYDKTTAELHEANVAVSRRLRSMEEFFRDNTEYHCDVHLHGRPSSVILIGHYHGKDFVRSYSVTHDTLRELARHLRELELRAKMGRIDVYPENLRQIISHEVKD
jgi:hypothetical protein